MDRQHNAAAGRCKVMKVMVRGLKRKEKYGTGIDTRQISRHLAIKVRRIPGLQAGSAGVGVGNALPDRSQCGAARGAVCAGGAGPRRTSPSRSRQPLGKVGNQKKLGGTPAHNACTATPSRLPRGDHSYGAGDPRGAVAYSPGMFPRCASPNPRLAPPFFHTQKKSTATRFHAGRHHHPANYQPNPHTHTHHEERSKVRNRK